MCDWLEITVVHLITEVMIGPGLLDRKYIQISFHFSEYTLIYNPASDGEVIQHAIIQNVATDQQENVDPNTQVLMLQPITITQEGYPDQTQVRSSIKNRCLLSSPLNVDQ